MLRGKNPPLGWDEPECVYTCSPTAWLRAFLPVTDGTFITALPSVQLNQRKVNGKRMLVGVSL